MRNRRSMISKMLADQWSPAKAPVEHRAGTFISDARIMHRRDKRILVSHRRDETCGLCQEQSQRERDAAPRFTSEIHDHLFRED